MPVLTCLQRTLLRLDEQLLIEIVVLIGYLLLDSPFMVIEPGRQGSEL